MFTTRSFDALSARLDSEDPKVILAAAVEVWNRTFDAKTAFLLSKSAHHATALKGESARSFGAKVGKNHATIGNYSRAWDLAAKVGTPEPTTVAHAYTIESNNPAKVRDAWYATMPEEESERRDWLLGSDYRNLLPEPEVTEPTEPTEPEVTEPEEITEPEAPVSDAEAQLQVLRTLVGRIERGDFMVSEAVKFADVAKGIIAAVEGFATGAAHNVGTRSTVKAGK